MPPAHPPHALVAALVAESARKSRVCWLSWPGSGPAPRLVWHAWYDGAVVVLAGEPDQQLAGLGTATTAEVTMRSKDTGGRLLTWTAAVQVVDPGSSSWDEHALALLGVRLNLPDPAAALQQWRTERTVVRLVPVEAGQDPVAGPLP